MINKNGSRCNYTKPKFQQKRQKQKQKGTLSWESKSSIKLFYVQSHIPPHLQSSVHGSPTLLQEQRPEHLLFALHPPFVSSLHASDTLGCVIQHGTKIFPCLLHRHSSGFGRFCIGINDWS